MAPRRDLDSVARKGFGEDFLSEATRNLVGRLPLGGALPPEGPKPPQPPESPKPPEGPKPQVATGLVAHVASCPALATWPEATQDHLSRSPPRGQKPLEVPNHLQNPKAACGAKPPGARSHCDPKLVVHGSSACRWAGESPCFSGHALATLEGPEKPHGTKPPEGPQPPHGTKALEGPKPRREAWMPLSPQPPHGTQPRKPPAPLPPPWASRHRFPLRAQCAQGGEVRRVYRHNSSA